MIRNLVVSTVALGTVAVMSSTASAAWISGQTISVDGSFTALEQPPVPWGSWAGQGGLELGGAAQYFAPVAGGAFIGVSATVISPSEISIVLDYSEFPFFEIGTHQVVFPDLKGPDAQLSASSSVGSTGVLLGTIVSWSAEALDLPQDGLVKISITQIPSPGALALVGIAALGTRRRRN